MLGNTLHEQIFTAEREHNFFRRKLKRKIKSLQESESALTKSRQHVGTNESESRQKPVIYHLIAQMQKK